MRRPRMPTNPNFGSVRGMFYEGRSYFNGPRKTQLAKRMSHGFQVQGTFYLEQEH